MPIRPGVVYPAAWREFTATVRARAEDRCQCEGVCGRHQGSRCVERNGTDALDFRGRVVLTVAHLNAEGGPCRCDPLCADEAHVLAMCQKCHNRYDQPMRTRHAAATRRAGKATLDLFGEGT